MSGTVFWDVDTQHDFVMPDGKLHVPGAETIVDNLRRLTDYAHARGIRIVASADDHEPSHRELSDEPDFEETFPPHCMRGTRGQRKIPQTELENPMVIEPEETDEAALQARIRQHRGDILLNKHWFDVFTNPNVEPVLEVLDPESIILYGVALDICNKYAIEGLLARRPQTRLLAVTDAMKPIDQKKADTLLESWEERSVQLVSTDRALELVDDFTKAESGSGR